MRVQLTFVSLIDEELNEEISFNFEISSIQTHHSTPHSVHSLSHHRGLIRDPRDFYYSSRERERDRARYRERMRDYDLQFEQFHDRERELYERERERDHVLERERL